ncbi:hypothetical protein EVAR_39910_1 [Eumeta japonica]|uniref:Uncharacterized protein n=1 Tax=Eumeta variegata TaxID=151549 RepID=A0A4C1WMD6_EUMVA|nr:hypothetical protein EVAR_39910_1 [Eumeta japonica]
MKRYRSDTEKYDDGTSKTMLTLILQALKSGSLAEEKMSAVANFLPRNPTGIRSNRVRRRMDTSTSRRTTSAWRIYLENDRRKMNFAERPETE